MRICGGGDGSLIDVRSRDGADAPVRGGGAATRAAGRPCRRCPPLCGRSGGLIIALRASEGPRRDASALVHSASSRGRRGAASTLDAPVGTRDYGAAASRFIRSPVVDALRRTPRLARLRRRPSRGAKGAVASRLGSQRRDAALPSVVPVVWSTPYARRPGPCGRVAAATARLFAGWPLGLPRPDPRPRSSSRVARTEKTPRAYPSREIARRGKCRSVTRSATNCHQEPAELARTQQRARRRARDDDYPSRIARARRVDASQTARAGASLTSHALCPNGAAAAHRYRAPPRWRNPAQKHR